MTIAYHRSACAADCGQAIQPGERIARADGDEWVHEECTDTLAALDFGDPRDAQLPADNLPRLGPRDTVCPDCWLVQPCDCEKET